MVKGFSKVEVVGDFGMSGEFWIEEFLEWIYIYLLLRGKGKEEIKNDDINNFLRKYVVKDSKKIE